MKFNYEHVDEPLPATEINGLIKAVLKKDYAYTCKQAPAPTCNYCERSKCIKRDYGIGGMGRWCNDRDGCHHLNMKLRTGHQSDGTSLKCREKE